MISGNIRGLSADTGLVCLLLAAELGRSASSFSMDAGLIALTLAVVSTVPFFLAGDGISIGKWVGSRAAIAAVGLLIGASLGETSRFIPMSLLIVAALISCSVQFYSLFKLRPAD